MTNLIACCSTEHSRYTRFWASLMRLEVPPDSAVITLVGTELAESRNEAIRRADALEAEWIWFLDDDHEVPPDALRRLLAHDLPLVGPLYLRKAAPFDPASPVRLEGLPYGLCQVPALGASGLLIRRPVWERVPEPWFVLGPGSRLREDLNFCHAARFHGFTPMMDTTVVFSHLAPAALSAIYARDTGWTVICQVGGITLAVPPIRREDTP